MLGKRDGDSALSLSQILSKLSENRDRIIKVTITPSSGYDGGWRNDGYDSNGYLKRIYMQYHI